MNDRNRQVYESKDVVEYYQQADELQQPEQFILNEFRERFAEMRFLDIGIGGGRTTHHFAPLVAEYVGIDYADEMINACRQRFRDRFGSMTLRVVDARNLHVFDENDFDFILFSYNGIDSITHEERLGVLKDILRACRPGGYFCFSSHNLNADLSGYYRFRLYPDWRITYKKFKWSLMFYLRNHGRWRWSKQQYARIYDDAHFFRLKNYYIRPQAQIEQLARAGFVNIRLFSATREIDRRRIDLSDLKDSWIYYLCNK